MKKYFLPAFIFFSVVTQAVAQNKMSAEDSLRFENFKREQQVIQQASEVDYKTMLKQLHIDSTRHGPSGNSKDANAANSDESKVPPYTLPGALTLKNGRKVTGANTWWQKEDLKLLKISTKKCMFAFLQTHQKLYGKL